MMSIFHQLQQLGDQKLYLERLIKYLTSVGRDEFYKQTRILFLNS
jgi:hypothetical protein